MREDRSEREWDANYESEFLERVSEARALFVALEKRLRVLPCCDETHLNVQIDLTRLKRGSDEQLNVYMVFRGDDTIGWVVAIDPCADACGLCWSVEPAISHSVFLEDFEYIFVEFKAIVVTSLKELGDAILAATKTVCSEETLQRALKAVNLTRSAR